MVTTAAGARRLAGLDGLRGIAALFVVVHHCWLSSYPGFPNGSWPGATTWMAYGHLAVAVFIMLSGYSLAVGPARGEWRLGGVARFLRRRAWRILPPYWAALAFSLLMAWLVAPQPGATVPTGKSVLVFGTLSQDVFDAPTPNGPFWSIAIEAQLYLLMPLLLLVHRRVGPGAMLALVLVPALAIELLAGHVQIAALLLRFVPQMAVLFAVGVLTAYAVSPAGRTRWARVPWGAVAGIAAVGPVLLIASTGTAWTVSHYFWVDLAVAPAVAALLAGLSFGRPAWLLRILDTAPLRGLGGFSYSLYLVHAPIVVAVSTLVVAGRVPPGVPTLLVMLAIAVPLSVLCARGFAAVFELPFQRYRSREALVAAVAGRAQMRLGSVP